MGGYHDFWKNESGQGMVEYGLIICLISIAAVGVLTMLGPQIENLFSKDEIQNALTSP